MSSEMNGSKTQIILGALTLIGVLGAAVIANWDKLFQQNRPPTPIPTPMPSPTPPSPPPTAEINISGVWRDEWGLTSRITQQGNTFKYTASGVACRGSFQTSGSGTIKGNIVESGYQSTYSTGHCYGTVSSDGRQMTSTCADSACGQFQSSAVKQ